jgi:hypothetical protein
MTSLPFMQTSIRANHRANRIGGRYSRKGCQSRILLVLQAPQQKNIGPKAAERFANIDRENTRDCGNFALAFPHYEQSLVLYCLWSLL